MIRDEIRDLLGHGCKEEEIVAALTMTGSDPDSVRRVLRELNHPAPPTAIPKKVARRAKLVEKETTLDPRVRIFHVAEGLTRKQIGAALPDESPRFIDMELAAMLQVMAGQPPILKLVRGVYRMKKHYRPRPDDERRVRAKKGETS